MRSTVAIALVAGVLTVVTVGTVGCARGATGSPPAVAASALDRPAGTKEADVYVQVLRRYLTTPAENSFPGQTFKTVYVLDHTRADAADPAGQGGQGAPIAPNTQDLITAALAGVAPVRFIADRAAVIETRDGCAQVRDGGILITVGPPNGDDTEVRVAINGFVACLGATWLTYVVRNQPGIGWRVTGTTGSMAIA